MDRTQFIAVTAVILFVAFVLGWFAHWLVHRFTRIGQSELSEVDSLARALHEAEDQRDQTVAYLNQREAEMANAQAQTEAELRAAMDGLREARQEAEELRAYIERVNQG